MCDKPSDPTDVGCDVVTRCARGDGCDHRGKMHHEKVGVSVVMMKPDKTTLATNNGDDDQENQRNLSIQCGQHGDTDEENGSLNESCHANAGTKGCDEDHKNNEAFERSNGFVGLSSGLHNCDSG